MFCSKQHTISEGIVKVLYWPNTFWTEDVFKEVLTGEIGRLVNVVVFLGLGFGNC